MPQGIWGRSVIFESHFDRFRPQVRDRWREQGGPGSGIWYDLGPHLLDQAVNLFGLPVSIAVDLAQQRPGAQATDYFHAVLVYPQRRVIFAQYAAGGGGNGALYRPWFTRKLCKNMVSIRRKSV